MPNISKSQIEEKIRNLIEMEHLTLDEITPEHLINEEDQYSVDLFSFYQELESVKVELKQMNRLEKTRLETLKNFLDDETSSKNQLLENIEKVVRQSDESKNRNIIQSIIEIMDYIGNIESGLAGFQNQKPLLFGRKKKQLEFESFTSESIKNLRKKVEILLEKEMVYPISTLSAYFDPDTMIATEIANQQNLPDNVVIEESQTGYICKNEMLRYSKVKVNQHKHGEIKNDFRN
ncbi:MAG: nucleotide exchange factor GrpE [Deltaproteobacteria bacterium]|nr:nucleotide exchange factor GrpE [Deltaproteobacteria bacterium]